MSHVVIPLINTGLPLAISSGWCGVFCAGYDAGALDLPGGGGIGAGGSVRAVHEEVLSSP